PNRLAPVDVFVSSVDPLKEPPIITANTVLSILAADYPVDKLCAYVSDDGASMLLFDSLAETAEFARRRVPFCKKHNVEPRAPDSSLMPFSPPTPSRNFVYTKPEPYAILIVYFSAYTLISFFKKRENPSNSIFLSCFRVLKIDRSEPSDLNLSEDPVVYSSQEIKNLLQRIAEGNRATGGLNFVTKVYGIAGCIKFLESYYLILVTKRRQIGCVCGHAIYSIDESQLVPIPHVSIQTDVSHSKTELW
ncbi:hypothetical protein G4B88_014955, partial [Cannabis sativa]